jgi:alcohol dehydrogenase class IV
VRDQLTAVALIPYVSRIQFGFGAREMLGAELALLDAHRALVVSDRGVVESGVLERALEYLDRDVIAGHARRSLT